MDCERDADQKIMRLFEESIATKRRFADESAATIKEAAELIIKSIFAGGKVIIFGNGGSAADSQHIAAELVGRFRKERCPLAAVALTTNTSNITALANDYGYGVIFKRQVEALGKKGDVAIAISTSGGAESVIEAAKACKGMGIAAIALTGRDGGALAPICDIAMVVPSNNTARIQETHSIIGHILCELIEDACACKAARPAKRE